MKKFGGWVTVYLLMGLLPLSCMDDGKPAFSVKVEAEELVYKYKPPENGAGPMWCHGNTCLIRYGEKLVASGMETLAQEVPLNNTRWLLFERTDKGWEMLMKDETERTREPSPLGVLNQTGTVLLSVNPTLTEKGVRNGPSQPRILMFDIDNMKSGYRTIIPEWEGDPDFTEHSYRTFVVDGGTAEFILFQNTGYDLAEWVFFDRKGKKHSLGQLVWPWGKDYEEPQPVRICYPAVQLTDRDVHFLGVSDIVEPKKAWKDYKYNLTGREWDYDFRRLFYTWTRDISTGRFEPWVEVASREETAGHIFPCDLWRAPEGKVHILWTEKALDERLRKDFFPGQTQSHALNHGLIRDGEVTHRQPVMLSNEQDTLLPGRGRFHLTSAGRLFVFFHVYARNGDFEENRVVEILKDNSLSPSLNVPLQRPFRSFYTATIRAGSKPADVIDVFGEDGREEMRYARIRIIPD